MHVNVQIPSEKASGVVQQIYVLHPLIYTEGKPVAGIAIQPPIQPIFWQRTSDMAPQQTSWLNDPTNMGLFFGTFLLSLFLAVSALPMALLAWRRKM
jgi:hypothetical protein